MIKFIKSLTKMKILAIALVTIGLVLVIFFGIRTIHSFREMQYIREQGLDIGTADIDDIRPWMTVQFIAVAYGVPQEYIFAELDIPFERRNSNDTLHSLNQKYDFGRPDENHGLPILNEIKDTILQYQENPVTTGLAEDVRLWMSIRYIANSTGVPEEFIFAQIGIPVDGNQGKPLERLDKEFKFGGRREIVEAVKDALAQYGENQ